MRLARLFGRGEGDGSTAGAWLVLGQGLLLKQHPHLGGAWRVEPYPWLNSRERVGDGQPMQHLWDARRGWLARHGLAQAEFPRRRETLAAVEYALQRDPLPVWEQGRSQLDGSTVGLWLVPGHGLLLHRWEGNWRVQITAWLETDRRLDLAHQPPGWWEQRQRWLHRHGFHQAEFPRRRDALAAVEYALLRDPLPRG